jgi:hypothetical protein
MFSRFPTYSLTHPLSQPFTMLAIYVDYRKSTNNRSPNCDTKLTCRQVDESGQDKPRSDCRSFVNAESHDYIVSSLHWQRSWSGHWQQSFNDKVTVTWQANKSTEFVSLRLMPPPCFSYTCPLVIQYVPLCFDAEPSADGLQVQRADTTLGLTSVAVILTDYLSTVVRIFSC